MKPPWLRIRAWIFHPKAWLKSDFPFRYSLGYNDSLPHCSMEYNDSHLTFHPQLSKDTKVSSAMNNWRSNAKVWWEPWLCGYICTWWSGIPKTYIGASTHTIPGCSHVLISLNAPSNICLDVCSELQLFSMTSTLSMAFLNCPVHHGVCIVGSWTYVTFLVT